MVGFNAPELIIPGIVFVSLLFLFLLLSVTRKKLAKRYGRVVDTFFLHLRLPFQMLLIITALYIVFKSLKHEWTWNPLINHVYLIIAIGILGWLAIKAVKLISTSFLHHYDMTKKNNNHDRKINTQILVFRRLAIAAIIFLVAVSILMSFEAVRAQGISLLASAGILSIIVGLAAQKTLGSLFTGIQIAISQPIKIDDVVVVENEWGRIEEINLSFVVVKLWDLRRMVLPITYFTERPFQNWTRQTADLLGAVMLYVDYTMPIQPIREELDRLLDGNTLWDGKVKVVQVTNIQERTVEIRILVSSEDSGAVFDLKCAIREGLISFIQKNYFQHLPRVRTEITKDLPPVHTQEGPDPKEPIRAPAPTLGANIQPKEI